MSSPSKQKGNRVERIIVDTLKEYGFDAVRAWGSNGQALGEHEEVDVLIKSGRRNKDKIKIQVKGRKKIAEYLKPNLEIVHWQIIKEDRQEPLVVLPLSDLLRRMK
jgi:Holliday junction resolvase|tara:strand:- start:7906 stop:8223 length:318 start_codon:yes stop_codon:yes gene_type:complete